MNMRPSSRLPISIAGCLALASTAPTALAQSTAFTYQGELKSGGAPANGLHDLRFKLWNAATAGLVMAPVACVDNVQVTNGKFTATIDFGTAFVTAGSRFIEVDVRQDTGLDCTNTTGFATLAPRTLVTAAPLATYANKASVLTPANATGLDAVTVDASGNVGVGTSTPTANLHVMTAGAGVRIQGQFAGVNNGAYLAFANGSGTDLGYIGDGSSGDNSMYLTSYANDVHIYTAAGAALSAKASGNVGIGTPTPAAKLDVRGDIKLGSSGQYNAVKSPLNDRVVRGYVNAVGTILTPQSTPDFTVTHNATGVFTITFTTPFSSPPTVVMGATSQCCKPRLNGNAQTTQFFVHVNAVDAAFTLSDSPFTFIAIGPG